MARCKRGLRAHHPRSRRQNQVLNRFEGTTNGQHVPWGKPWDRQPVSGKVRRKLGVSPGFAAHFGAPHPKRSSTRENQRGFALMLVFLMASIVAIMLYMELPRAAMQAQRDKEEMLIDRGEQYKRAIQLFVNKARRYPAQIKDLENFNNQRFLRQRYEIGRASCRERV